MKAQSIASDTVQNNAKKIGNKAANLIKLQSICPNIKSDLIQTEVPDFATIADATVKKYLDSYAPTWRNDWAQFIALQGNNTTLSEAAIIQLETCRKSIMDAFINNPFKIKKNEFSKDCLLMVRSTGEEDTKDMANPGGNESVAAVKLKMADISHAIGRVVSSYFSENSLRQRLLSHDDITKPPFVPVLIQQMVGEKLNGEMSSKKIVVSGVMYAKENAMTHLDVALGHGELIVNSQGLFDSYDVTTNGTVHAAIHRKKNRLIPTEIKDKNGQLKRTLTLTPNPQAIQNTPALSVSIAREIAKAGQAIRAEYGMDLDIEFVYQPDNQVLHIVQARPIPASKKRKIEPSSIAPEVWPTFKKIKIPANVISPAGQAAKIIKHHNDVILSDTIDNARITFLKDNNRPKKPSAVVVKSPAPSTSHAAALFNAADVLVMQSDTTPIEIALKNTTPLIFDSQRQAIVPIKEKKSVSEIKKLIQNGLFTSSTTPEKTLLPIDSIDKKNVDIIKGYLADKTISPPTIYEKLIECLSLLEAAKPHSHNKPAFSALKTMASIFKKMATSSRAKNKDAPHKKIFVHAMNTIADIHEWLEKYSKLNTKHQHLHSIQQLGLDMINKLKALIVNPGEDNLNSDSVMQIAAQNKVLADNVTLKKMNISPDERAYLIEFLKLNTLALNGKIKKKWTQLALFCCKDKTYQQQLTKILKFSGQHQLHFELLNHYFHALKQDQKKRSHPEVLKALYKNLLNHHKELRQYKLDKNEQIIAAWEKRTAEWAKPEQFDKLYKQFEIEISDLINNLSLKKSMPDLVVKHEKSMPDLVNKAILKQVQSLTQMMDNTIKSLKGSSEYATEKEGVVVTRFILLLKLYHQLMNKWMREIPSSQYDEWAMAGLRTNLSAKEFMLLAIKEVFTNKFSTKDMNELQPSGAFSVVSAKIGSTASFYRQFYQRSNKITLEDLFSLFHQNLLTCTAVLGEESQVESTQLPEVLQPLLKKLKSNTSVQLLSITTQLPHITLEYNVPLRNHSAKLIFDYHIKNQQLNLHGYFFGHNEGNRMNKLARVAKLEGSLLDCNQPFEPFYNESSYNMEFAWELKADKINVLMKHINDIIYTYSQLTNNNGNNDPSTVFAVMKRHMQNKKSRNTSESLSADMSQNFKSLLQSNLYFAICYIIVMKISDVALIKELLQGKNITSELDQINDLDSEILNLQILENLINAGCEIDVPMLFSYVYENSKPDAVINFISAHKLDLSDNDHTLKWFIEQPNLSVHFLDVLFQHKTAIDDDFKRYQFDQLLKNPKRNTLIKYLLDELDSNQLTAFLFWHSDTFFPFISTYLNNLITHHLTNINWNHKEDNNSYQYESLLQKMIPFITVKQLDQILKLPSFNLDAYFISKSINIAFANSESDKAIRLLQYKRQKDLLIEYDLVLAIDNKADLKKLFETPDAVDYWLQSFRRANASENVLQKLADLKDEMMQSSKAKSSKASPEFFKNKRSNSDKTPGVIHSKRMKAK